jgi:hypothetical protein
VGGPPTGPVGGAVAAAWVRLGVVAEPVDGRDSVKNFGMPSLTLRRTDLLGDFPHLDPLFTRSHTTFFPRFHFLHNGVSARKFCPEPVGEYIREVSGRSAQLAAGASLPGGWFPSVQALGPPTGADHLGPLGLYTSRCTAYLFFHTVIFIVPTPGSASTV